jgi:hypothetical protein
LWNPQAWKQCLVPALLERTRITVQTHENDTCNYAQYIISTNIPAVRIICLTLLVPTSPTKSIPDDKKMPAGLMKRASVPRPSLLPLAVLIPPNGLTEANSGVPTVEITCAVRNPMHMTTRRAY